MKSNSEKGNAVAGFLIFAAIALIVFALLGAAVEASSKVGPIFEDVGRQLEWQAENRKIAGEQVPVVPQSHPKEQAIVPLVSGSEVYFPAVDPNDYNLKLIQGMLYIPDTTILDTEDLAMLAKVYTLSHGQKHEEYWDVRNCMDNKGASYRIVLRPSKYVDVCEMLGGWGFQPWKRILQGKNGGNNDTWAEITAYQKDYINSLDDLVQYAKNNGVELYKLVGEVASKIYP